MTDQGNQPNLSDQPSSSDAPNSSRAVLFDIDGTLIDSNYLHVEAWTRALVEVGHPVDTWRIHRGIGMGSGKLLRSLLGADAERLSEHAKRLHATYLAETASLLRPFARAAELLRTVAAHNVQVVLATSAPADELEQLLRVLDAEDALSVVTSSEDVHEAKPNPDIIHTALRSANVSNEHAFMVGDAVWDVEAAGRAGLPCVGVLTGGTGEAELQDAGAVAIYDDVAALLAGLERSPLATLWSR